MTLVLGDLPASTQAMLLEGVELSDDSELLANMTLY